jgi:hypothetical protein
MTHFFLELLISHGLDGPIYSSTSLLKDISVASKVGSDTKTSCSFLGEHKFSASLLKRFQDQMLRKDLTCQEAAHLPSK